LGDSYDARAKDLAGDGADVDVVNYDTVLIDVDEPYDGVDQIAAQMVVFGSYGI